MAFGDAGGSGGGQGGDNSGGGQGAGDPAGNAAAAAAAAGGQGGTAGGQNGGGTGGGGNPAAAGGGNGGGDQKSWRDSLPDDLKSHASIQTFKDLPALVQSYVHAQSQLGKKGIIAPGENATEAELNDFYKALGRPELDKYEVKTPEGKKINPDFLKEMKEVAHKMGILPKQAQGFFDWYLGFEQKRLTETTTSFKKQREDGMAELKKELGADGFTSEAARADSFVKEVDPKWAKFFADSGLDKDPMMARFMMEASKKFMKEDSLRGDGQGGRTGALTKADAQKKINEIMGNPNHPYKNAKHPSHKDAVDEMAGYNKIIYGAQ
jgi:hypothetical protein